jgi:hypothetical protein
LLAAIRTISLRRWRLFGANLNKVGGITIGANILSKFDDWRMHQHFPGGWRRFLFAGGEHECQAKQSG